jgi:hypothetical protein
MGTAVAGTSFRPARSYTTLWDVTAVAKFLICLAENHDRLGRKV